LRFRITFWLRVKSGAVDARDDSFRGGTGVRGDNFPTLEPIDPFRQPAPAYDVRIETAPSDPGATDRGCSPPMQSKSDSERETGIATVVRASNNEGETVTHGPGRARNNRLALR